MVEGGEGADAIARDGPHAGCVRAALGRLELLGLVAWDGFAGYIRVSRAADAASSRELTSPVDRLP